MKPVQRTATLRNEQGLHLRPAAELARLVQSFSAEVLVVKDGRLADARSVFGLLILGIAHGESVELHASGADAEAAVDAVHAFLCNHTESRASEGTCFAA